jgi:hypothetical protein
LRRGILIIERTATGGHERQLIAIGVGPIVGVCPVGAEVQDVCTVVRFAVVFGLEADLEPSVALVPIRVEAFSWSLDALAGWEGLFLATGLSSKIYVGDGDPCAFCCGALRRVNVRLARCENSSQKERGDGDGGANWRRSRHVETG